MAVHSFSKPCVVTSKGARQIKDILSAPAPKQDFTHTSSLTSAKKLVEKYHKK